MTLLKFILYYVIIIYQTNSLRIFQAWSTRSQCDMAQFPNYPFAYTKYLGQDIENKGRVNTNLQDFRHACQVKGGRSKCHICEEIQCLSDNGTCALQLQGVSSDDMSVNLPTVSDTAWPIGGNNRWDFRNKNVTHICTFLSGGHCILHNNTDFSDCAIRCFGHGFNNPPRPMKPLIRSVVDVYPGMHRYPGDGAVSMWNYPRNCEELKIYDGRNCTYYGPNFKTPDYNPQGFTFTLAGNGIKGYYDGIAENAMFNEPEDVAVDNKGLVYVADTFNNAIRIIDNGIVKTLAGSGPAVSGFTDGDCASASFTRPKGVDVIREIIDGYDTIIVVVADTGNHRIRKIVYIPALGNCLVSCLSGLCGNNTLSATLYKSKASPNSGYADGSGLVARFSAPESVAFLNNEILLVADTGNFLVRLVSLNNGNTTTLAGTIVDGEKDADGNPLPGCPPPCLQGQQGFRDGNLSYAQFYNILDVTRGPNNTIFVVDEHRVRLIELPNNVTTYYSINSRGRVSTIAGNGFQGEDDGVGEKSTFSDPTGIFVTEDNIMYVADASTCKIRRLTPFPLAAQQISCSSDGTSLIRPSGCTSFDQTIDKIGRKISRVEANIIYSYGWPNTNNTDWGKYSKNCVGTPPLDKLQKKFWNISGDNLVIDDERDLVDEDSEQGMAILVNCPSDCGISTKTYTIPDIEGNHWYSEYSSICVAAIHDGVLTNSGGYLLLQFQRRDYINSFQFSYSTGTLRNGILSFSIGNDVRRVFSMELYHEYTTLVHSIGGRPNAPLESGCGYADGQPSTMSYFNRPGGLASAYDSNLTDTSFIYIADSGNNRIRGMSAVCTQICENQGRCIGHDKCACKPGWSGIDCTIPICSSCGDNKVCVGPELCACKPGYQNATCTEPQCIQHCHNGGKCIAPDTCKCASGWFDANCTTPVCSQTCANGGNCTAPNTCACPSQWKGESCREPVCDQVCLNNGACVAPNTCACSPQYSGYNCEYPVCTQGYFVPNGPYIHHYLASKLLTWPKYKFCDLQTWCNYTNEFECDQSEMSFSAIEVPSGPEYRAITGRKSRPNQCTNIELNITYKLPFELLNSDNSTSGFRRYSDILPYQSNSSNPWRGYLEPTFGHTGPWTYTPDRQVAFVNWYNATEGIYVCANSGNCTAPDVCECAPGWVGFDCRTPVCNNAYYYPDQKSYVSGEKTSNELSVFLKFLGNNSYRLNWPYSNPNYSIEYEHYKSNNYSVIERYEVLKIGSLYLGQSNWSLGYHISGFQGGYRCSIRAVTQWENITNMFEHPNFYTRYMDEMVQRDDKIYSYWENMSWPPTHVKSKILDQFVYNITYAYTNEGYQRFGIWNRTGNNWEYGICLLEFQRNCPSDVLKQYDLESNRYNVFVQDTDLAFRPRIKYNDLRVISKGRWKASGGECIDQVIRGCYNNGTCIGPNTCRCSSGWTGSFCNIPVCEQSCNHHGNCTGPNQCTCERGWEGYDCTIPMCAQECQNDGFCIAPDTCKCAQWDNAFVDGRAGGGRPLFQDSDGNALQTGWTGYDCSVPICVQAVNFYVNVPSTSSSNYISLGGHGGDAQLTCEYSDGKPLPRCPQYDNTVVTNDGTTFQTGCGYDPYDTGCCIRYANNIVKCFSCPSSGISITNNTFTCSVPYSTLIGYSTETDKFRNFLDSNENLKICGKYFKPRYHEPYVTPQDYGIPQYYKDSVNYLYSNHDFKSNLTSNRFLCNVDYWIQGDYIDDAGLGSITGVGSIYGLQSSRHIRINYPNVYNILGTTTWVRGDKIYGEGVYACANYGSCISPDVCTCKDGYSGYDCKTPLCRHLQPTGKVTSCLNGGVCVSKDNCKCVQTSSVSWRVHTGARHGITGWTGDDCSIPMCSQGYYDPFCTDLPQAPAGQGCYRCSNGGNCTAPDVCTCASGWTGYDCNTPVCEVVADPLTRTQLGTVYEDKVISFESDPCGVVAIYGRHGWKGTKYTRGNCTQPNQCTCLCKIPYNKKACHKTGKFCNGPWQDPLVQVRNVLITRGPEFIFGTTDCAYGYEGNVDDFDKFTTCHLTIYYPSTTDRSSLILIIVCSVLGFFGCILYYRIRQRLKKRYMLAKIERRRSKRSEEDEAMLG